MLPGQMTRRFAQLAAALLLVLVPALPAAAKSRSQRAADAIEAALATKDESARDKVVHAGHPDPWLIMEELRRRKNLDAVRFLAGSLGETERAALDQYLAVQADRPFPDASFKLLAEVLGLIRLDRAKAHKILLAHEPDVTTVIGVEILFGRGEMLMRARQPVECAKAFETAGDAANAIGWHRRASEALRKAGHTLERAGMYAEAIPLLVKSAEAAARVPLPQQEGVARYLQGMCTNVLGKPDEALALFELAQQRGREANSPHLEGMALDGMGVVHEGQGRSWSALEFRERSMELARKSGNTYSITVGLSNLASTLISLGHHERARRILLQAREGAQKLKELSFEAVVLINLGVTAMHVGDFDDSLRYQDRAIAIGTALGERPTVAKARSLKASTYLELGDDARARPIYQAALADYEAMGDVAAAAAVLQNLGHLAGRADDDDAALTYYRKARALRESIGDLRGAVRLQQVIATASYASGDAEAELKELREVLATQEQLRDTTGITLTRTNICNVLIHLKRFTEAVTVGEQAVREARETDAQIALVQALSALGDAQLGTGATLDARATAEAGIAALRRIAGGQAEEQEASARDRYRSIYAIGSLACWSNQDPVGLFLFLEAGRASALRRALGGGRALRSAAVSEQMREKEVALRRREGQAIDNLARARATGRRRAVRAMRKELDAIRAQLDDLIGRIERESQRGAELLYSRPLSLDVVQRQLAADEALVIYGMLGDNCCALVARKDGARIVDLGVDATTLAKECRSPSWSGAVPEATAGLDVLRARLVEPLALPADVRRLLISPAGEIALVPFGALDTKREIVIVPSGTAYAQLRAAKATTTRATAVLALGDPLYPDKPSDAALRHRGGTKLMPLPETRAEVESIGTVRLLGKDATEDAFRSALPKQERWRAVHFACHGLLNTKLPKFSSLALTTDAKDDGFLTAAEIVRLPIHADLVALSACDTGRGKIVRAEGVLGLTRAFFFAGAPRVLSSLWKVDSKATQALMLKFYELWNPQDPEATALTAAAALREAQAFIRAQKKWEHPYFWGAWVLSGLPE